MRTTAEFNMFGVNYRARQFAAAGAVGMFSRLDSIHPTELLALTEVQAGDKEWHPLKVAANIDRYVRDVCGAMQPREVLDLVMFEIRKLNFGFTVSKVAVPSRFRSRTDMPDDPDGQHPVLAWLFVEGKATWRELQEDYSLEDAFTMHRELLKSKVKAALEAEEAAKEAKAKAKGG
ncbi:MULTISPECIES: hypothetical protein [unclassified Caballeronia]|uniref:hypothetical protein n=1 Tax=unclassified Caballeronia TaxID=2646786 RepID=UPI0028543BFA|nr:MULTISPECIES: hypothetical protein [unclassified Caballeronia]MDR5751127.1 hypothetical protein [Caballeronia sp. LZ024]MDR5844736.1 hypothetical protein [Caballeronia sp. LZ031]